MQIDNSQDLDSSSPRTRKNKMSGFMFSVLSNFIIAGVVLTLSALFLPEIIDAPRFSDNPMWHISSVFVGGVLSTFVDLYIRKRKKV